ncbi:HAMP domain-containing protein [Actinokineospora iranica]|uniref:HAMP domain-containing protein n=1 Tax=Actinokineospora iranica TaxID=1271860 RepID=UPI000B897C2F|nr:HAMP domain-containing protein [Actinokineospora iranica]
MPATAVLVLLVLLAGVCALLLSVRETDTAVAESQRELVTAAGQSLGASISQNAGDLRVAAAAAKSGDLLARLGKVRKWRGAAVLDAKTRKLIASTGEQVPLEVLPPVITDTAVGPVPSRDGTLRIVTAVALPDGRLLAAVSATSLSDAVISGGQALLLTTAGGQILDAHGAVPAPDDQATAALVARAAKAGAAGESGVLDGPARDSAPDRPVVAYAPVAAAGLGPVGLAAVGVLRVPAHPAGGDGGGALPAVVLLAVAVGGFLLVRGTVVTPVLRLRADALAVAGGDLDHAVRFPRAREPRRIAAAIEHCARTIRAAASAPRARAGDDWHGVDRAARTYRLKAAAHGGGTAVSSPVDKSAGKSAGSSAADKSAGKSVGKSPVGKSVADREPEADVRARGGRLAWRGLSVGVAVGVAAVGILGWSAGVVVTIADREAAAPDSVVSSLRNQTAGAGDAVQRSLNDGLADLRAVVTLTDPDTLAAALDLLRATQPRYRSVYVVDDKGQVGTYTGRPPLRAQAPPPADSGVRQDADHGRVAVLYAHVPLPGGGAAIGEFDLDRITDLLGRGPGTVRLLDSGSRTLAATGGYVAFAEVTDGHLRRGVADAAAGDPVARVEEGTVVVAAALRKGAVGELGWSVLAEKPVGDLALADNTVRRLALFVALVGVLLAVLLFGWHHFVVVRPLRALADQADRLAAGDTAGVLYPQRHDEIGTVTSCLEICRQGVVDGAGRLGEVRRPTGSATEVTVLMAPVDPPTERVRVRLR